MSDLSFLGKEEEEEAAKRGEKRGEKKVERRGEKREEKFCVCMCEGEKGDFSLSFGEKRERDFWLEHLLRCKEEIERERKVFGVCLEVLEKREMGLVPSFLRDCLEIVLEKKERFNLISFFFVCFFVVSY